MAPVNHLYLTVKGTRTNANLAAETWQFGTRLVMDSGTELADVGNVPSGLNTENVEKVLTDVDYDCETNFAVTKFNEDLDTADYLVEKVAPAVTTLMQNSAMILSNTCQVREINLYAYGANGRVVQTDLGPAKATYTYQNIVKGYASGNPVPPFVAVAASLYTPNRTRKGRGRIYLPPFATSAINSDGMMSESTTRNTAQGVAAYLNALKLDAGLSLPWVSNISLRPVVIGAPWQKYFAVTEVRVGNIFDTQRRRKNQLNEAYHTEIL